MGEGAPRVECSGVARLEGSALVGGAWRGWVGLPLLHAAALLLRCTTARAAQQDS